MLIDTDVLIWALRGDQRAADAINTAPARAISIINYMELLQGARDKREIKVIKSFLADLQIRTWPLTENIGHRASIYMEEYGLSAGMKIADALIAATAVENHLTLLTANRKHYRAIRDVDMQVFKP